MPANDSPAFDPYHRWLGIPPSDQPVNHYRLLGIALFESESDVIAAAADRQMAHVKQFATGQYRAESQRLLNELAKARVTLLNLQRKAEYDRALERRLTEQRPAAPTQRVAAAAPIAPSAPVEQAEDAGFAFERMPSRSLARPRKRQQSNQSLPLLLVMIGVTVIAGILAYAALTAPRETPQRAEKPQPPVAPAPLPPQVRSPQRAAPVVREAPAPAAIPIPATLSAPIAAPPERDRPEPEIIATKKTPAKPPKIEVIDLDLENRQQNVLLDHADALKVAVLKDCKSRAKILPAGGRLSVDRDVKVEIEGERPVTLTISLKERPNDQVLVTIESSVKTDDGRELPFTLANVGRVVRQVSKKSEQASAGQASLEAEKRQLTTWLGGPGMKPLIDVNSARSRLRAIESLLPGQISAAGALQAELVTAERVQELAEHLHEDCSLELEIAEP